MSELPRPLPARVALAVAAVGLAGLVAAVSLRRLGDFDLPLHVALGRLIWQRRGVPRVDDFSYLHGTIRYVELVSVSLFWGAYRAGGALGLQLVGGASAGVVAVALFAQTRRTGAAAMLGSALALAGAASFLVVRSSALSFALLALTTWALDAHRRAAGTRAARRALGAFVALALVWASTHGSVPFALVLGAAYAGYRAACRLARGRLGGLLPAADGADAGPAAIAVVLAVAAASVNTAGPGLLLGPLRFGGRTDLLAAFSEWARPTWSFYIDREAPALGALVVLLGGAALGRDEQTGSRVPSLYDAGLAAIALACSVAAVRLVPFALVLAAPVFARRVSRALGSLPATGAVHLGCAAATLMAPAAALRSPLPLGVGFDTSHFPEGAARWAEAHRPEGPLWNPMSFGGYLVFRLYPAVRVLIDGRHAAVYDLADVEAAAASERDPAAFAALERARGLDWAVTRAFEGQRDGLPLAASADWTMVFVDDVAAVYVRRGGPDGRFAADGYRLLRHLTPPGRVLALAEQPGDRAGDLAHDGALAAAQAPGSARAAFLDACGAMAARDAPRFQAAKRALTALQPWSAAIGALDAAWERVGAAGQ